MLEQRSMNLVLRKASCLKNVAFHEVKRCGLIQLLEEMGEVGNRL